MAKVSKKELTAFLDTPTRESSSLLVIPFPTQTANPHLTYLPTTAEESL